MTTKINFDITRSLRECPPEVYYNQKGVDGKPLFKGVHFIKRIVLNRASVSFRLEDQPREEDAGENRTYELTTSYRNNHFIYSKPPQAITKDINDPKRFRGVGGFGRDRAQDVLGWETMIYDVLEFDSPLDEDAFKTLHNETDEHVPAFQNTKSTYVKSIVNAVHSGVIKDDDDAIMTHLKRICRRRPDWHTSILSTVRKEHISRIKTMKAWNTNSATEYAKEMNLPYGGDKNKNVTELGYVRKKTSNKNTFWDAMVTASKAGFAKVGIYTWVDEPNPSTLANKRQEIVDQFEKMEEDFQKWISWYIDMDIAEVRERGEGRFPVELRGFLPQDTQRDADNNGHAVETGIIN